MKIVEESGLRPSERSAAAAVALMTVPAFLVFPLLGLWAVAHHWSGMGVIDQIIFCCAVAVFLAGVPACFFRGMVRIKQGRPEGLTPVERSLIYFPIAAGDWALTHRLSAAMIVTVWWLWSLFSAHRRQGKQSSD